MPANSSPASTPPADALPHHRGRPLSPARMQATATICDPETAKVILKQSVEDSSGLAAGFERRQPELRQPEIRQPQLRQPQLRRVDPATTPLADQTIAADSLFAASADDVIANHTANRPNLKLSQAYITQSIRTAAPLVAADVMAAMIGYLAAFALMNLFTGGGVSTRMQLNLPVWIVLQTLLMAMHGLYPGAGVPPVMELRGSVRSIVLTAAAMVMIHLSFGQCPPAEWIAMALTTVFTIFAASSLRYGVRRRLAESKWWGMRMLVVGSPQRMASVYDSLVGDRRSGLIPIGYVCNHIDFEIHRGHDPRLLGRQQDAAAIALKRRVAIAAIAADDSHPFSERLLFQFPSLFWIGRDAMVPPGEDPVGIYANQLRTPFLSVTARVIKRSIDLVLVTAGLLVLAFPLAIVAGIIKWKSPGPVFYGSPRIGQRGRSFRMWKFRSMVTNANEVLQAKLATDADARQEWEQDQKLKVDPRIIPGIGHFIRKTSLDEMPQLWNVLVGEMSLVGPRPLPPAEIVKYQDLYYQYSHMWPGITGLWQVSGRNDTDFETRVDLVRHYAENWSVWLDTWILIKTPLCVLTRRGAY